MSPAGQKKYTLRPCALFSSSEPVTPYNSEEENHTPDSKPRMPFYSQEHLTPESEPTMPSYSDEVNHTAEDEIDSWIPSIPIDAVKTAVYHLLNITIHKYRTDRCNGCRINHPSQRQHDCLVTTGDYFYEENFSPLMKKLITPRFIPSIQCMLTARNMKSDDVKVRFVAETLLHEYKNMAKSLENTQYLSAAS